LHITRQGETTLKKKTPAKKAVRRPAPERPKEQRSYVEPKTAAEHGITCLSPAPGGGNKCGASVVWFDYEIGEKEFYKGFVCDAHRGSNRVEKLA
jgi:hypothetical protein